MAFITVTSTTKTINVDFGVYGGALVNSGIVPLKRAFSVEFIVFSLTNQGFIEATTTYNELTFPVSVTGVPGTFKVGSVNGVVPTDLDHLYELLLTIKG